MPHYQTEVRKEAVEFLEEHSDDIVESLVEGHDFDRNDMDWLDESFNDSITDRAYALTDAAWVIENSDNPETDSGLWEGQQPEEAICTKAAFTFGNDVYSECEDLYKEIVETYDDLKSPHADWNEEGLDKSDVEEDSKALINLEDDSERVVYYDGSEGYVVLKLDAEDPDIIDDVRVVVGSQVSNVVTVDGKHLLDRQIEEMGPDLVAVAIMAKNEKFVSDLEIEKAADKAFAQEAVGRFIIENTKTYEPVEAGSDEERDLLREWLTRNERDAGMRGGYPLGSSYIDARCGVGYGMPEVFDYVEFDHRVSRQVPHLAGKYKDDVEEYFNATFGSGMKP